MRKWLAGALLLGACYVKHTSVDCTVAWPGEVKVDQLRFTATVNGTIIFGPVARPFDESGGALTSPASLRFDVVDAEAGKAVHLFVEGDLQNKAVANGTGDFVFAKEKDVAVKITMTDLHTDCSKCETCCQDGVCVDAIGVDACGAATENCVVCDPLRADNCSATGICECGSTLLECAGGQHCVGGLCTCDGESCLGGCCNGADCETRTLATCGPPAGTCNNCGDVVADICSADGSCKCGIQDACGPNLHCVSGGCVCDSVGCSTGCCENNKCFSGNGDIDHCGNGGFACSACPQTPVAQTCSSTGQCSGCNPATCPNGCCSGVCTGQFSLVACGTAGTLCHACDVTKADTCNSATDGSCSCGANPPCNDGQHCVSGQCLCDQTSCGTGCCDAANVCQAGNDPNACGSAGNQCDTGCNACADGVCDTCKSTCSGCCSGSTCHDSPSAATGCGVNGGKCGACDPGGADSCSPTGECECGNTGAQCVAGQRCKNSQCVCDSTSCNVSGECCDGNNCVEHADNDCGTNGNACATCTGTTNTCSSGFVCQCGSAGVACPTAIANLCSGEACVCGNTGAACTGPGQVCNVSTNPATCTCDQALCNGLGGCCSGNVCVTSETTAMCGTQGAACSDCTATSTGTVDTCKASSGACQCGPGSGVTCPTAIGNICSTGNCVCGSTGAACGAGLKCSGTGTGAKCICDSSACGTLKGCCSSNGLSCIQPGSQTPTQCGLAGATCGDCTVGNLANECVTSGGGGGVCKCGSSTACLASNGQTCNQGSGASATCGCDVTNCGAITGCCNGLVNCVVDSAVTTATANAACGSAGAACSNCTTSTRSNQCKVTAGVGGACECGTGASCASLSGLSCSGAGNAGICVCDSTTAKCGATGLNGCCFPSPGVAGSICVTNATQSAAECGKGIATCNVCTHNETANLKIDACQTSSGNCECGTTGAACGTNLECVSGACVCTATSCASGCCSPSPGAAGSVCITSENPGACGINGAACKVCTHDTGANLGVGACAAATGNCECGNTGAACGTNLECVGTACTCTANSCTGCCDTGPTCVTASSENMTQCGDGTAGDACVGCTGNSVCDNTTQLAVCRLQRHVSGRLLLAARRQLSDDQRYQLRPRRDDVHRYRLHPHRHGLRCWRL